MSWSDAKSLRFIVKGLFGMSAYRLLKLSGEGTVTRPYLITRSFVPSSGDQRCFFSFLKKNINNVRSCMNNNNKSNKIIINTHQPIWVQMVVCSYETQRQTHKGGQTGRQRKDMTDKDQTSRHRKDIQTSTGTQKGHDGQGQNKQTQKGHDR